LVGNDSQAEVDHEKGSNLKAEQFDEIYLTEMKINLWTKKFVK
jgi:hypothetical protein